jgi:hypothetical protein
MALISRGKAWAVTGAPSSRAGLRDGLPRSRSRTNFLKRNYVNSMGDRPYLLPALFTLIPFVSRAAISKAHGQAGSAGCAPENWGCGRRSVFGNCFLSRPKVAGVNGRARLPKLGYSSRVQRGSAAGHRPPDRPQFGQARLVAPRNPQKKLQKVLTLSPSRTINGWDSRWY